MKAQIQEVIEELGLSVESTFVPFSISRNKHLKFKSLNWVIKLLRHGKEILSTEYSAGIAHAPSYNSKNKHTQDWAVVINAECEKGIAQYMGPSGNVWSRNIQNTHKKIEPDLFDVIYGLVVDSDVIQYSSFESWANSFGYSSDSIEALKTYNACLKIALSMSNALGNSAMEKLVEAYRDY